MTSSLTATLDAVLAPLADAPAWFVGLSGGSDSTVLLHLLRRWCETHPGSPPLTAIHVNHNLAAAAGQWQSHCESLCTAWGVPLRAVSVEVAGQASPEAAARTARYAAFEAVLPADAILFLAHHLDDQVETFFLRLLRGAGIEGLAAMPQARPLGHARVVRPLLEHTRADLDAYASAQALPFVEDPSNADSAIDRNFLRREVLPLLEQRWPGYRKPVGRATGHLARARDSLHHHLGVPPTVQGVLGDPGVELASLVLEEGGERLRLWLRQQGLSAPDEVALTEFVRQLREAGSARLQVGGVTLARYRDALYRLPPLERAGRARDYTLTPQSPVDVPGLGRIELLPTAGPGFLCGSSEAFTVRWRCGGERVRQWGRTGSGDLKSVFQALGVPPWWRDHVPLVYQGDHLLAVADLVTCQSPATRASAPPGETLWQVRWTRPDQTG